jgi:GDSL-like lipase/acylhydrolase family protein
MQACPALTKESDSMKKLWVMVVLCLFLLTPGYLWALKADLNGDGTVNLLDLAIMAEEWLEVEEFDGNLIQSGWLDVTQDPPGQTLNGASDEWWALVCDSQNNHVGRDGTVRGARVRLTDSSVIAGMGVAIIRNVTGNEYTVIGKSQEITSGLVNGVNEIVFSDPIKNVRSDDFVCLLVKPNSASTYMDYLTVVQDVLPINDSSTARLRWHDPAVNDYSSIVTGVTYDFNSGGFGFALLPICALMKSPKVMVVGDSISEGSPLNRSYRNDSTWKDREGAYASIAYRALGWDWEIGGNTQTANNFQELLNFDLTPDLWAKKPSYLHVHCGVNELSDGRDWGDIENDLDSILSQCRANDAKLILTAIFPYTGKPDNATGSHAQQLKRETWNQNMEAWALFKSDVTFIDINLVLGQERLTAKAGDPPPPPGNRWDLIGAYTYPDGLNVHLNKAGATAAGSAFAVALNSLE